MAGEKRALVAMSGGVDSSVVAYMVRQAGYECIGVTMLLCGDADAGQDAAAAAARLGISHETVDLRPQFREEVVRRFVETYESGATPNPCIACNRYMKFGALLALARSRGADCLVTGHYARVTHDGAAGRWLLRKALDAGKDQSYVLYALTQEQLAHVRFPLGELCKREVREMAEQLALPNAQKPESQDICFVPDGDYAGFLERHTGRDSPEGDIVDVDGTVLGRHRGAIRYTVGQRRGLGIAAAHRLYVCGKDMASNTVRVGPESALYASRLIADDLNWIAFETLDRPVRVRAKTRYRQIEQPATVSPLGDGRVQVDFDRPQRAMTVGQAVVFYGGGVDDSDLVLGGGTICAVPEQIP